MAFPCDEPMIIRFMIAFHVTALSDKMQAKTAWSLKESSHTPLPCRIMVHVAPI